MKKREPNIKREITLRVNLLYVLFLLLGGCIFGRILWLQYGPHGDELREDAENRAFFMERIDGKRGDILSAEGELLSTSIMMYYLGIDFGVDSLTTARFRAGVDGLADSLSRMFGDRSKAGYKAMLEAGFNRPRKGYRRLNPRLISYAELQRARTFPLLSLAPGYGGLSTERVYSRQNPYGSMALRTLGATEATYDTLSVPSRDTVNRRIQRMLTERGRYGLEYSFNEHLKGKAGWQMMQRQTASFSTPVESPLNVATTDGRSVVTTLDMDFQDVASSMLTRQLLLHGAMRGTVVLMEVESGDIKAIANLERVGDNVYERLNYAIAGRYEPGSTFKLASLLALLDDGMTLDSPVEVGNGVMPLPGGRSIRDDHTPESPVLTLKRVFETSSNVGFSRAVENRFKAAGREKEFVDYLVGLGFGDPMGTGVVGEAAPILHRPTAEERRSGDWHGNSAVYLAHGYGLEVSPLHTLALYNAVANGGNMVKPRLVSELRGDDLAQPRTFPTEVINPAIASPRTIAALAESLAGVVDEGTATVLRNPYYKVAAKTGTAQQGHYGGGLGQEYLATMVGYFPADRPRYSCIVSIWTRRGSWSDTYYGSTLAGPVFKAIADRVYVTRWDLQPDAAGVNPRIDTPPRIKGGPERDVHRVAGELGIRTAGRARRRDWVTTSPGTDSTTIAVARIDNAEGQVPQVVGMGLKDALWAIESRGLHASFTGRGRVEAQHPGAGESVRPGATVTITLK
ncbi:MAG: PASTA domain-containing protein [Alistipes sp.]|jgi:cell division protein FtsI (penicillin-binding protein 3)|nr:PASTA domain-containing protein [Alistipes sp.]